MSSEVTLRRAGLADCERVYAYNAAPAARAVSGSASAFSFGDHQRWYAAQLVDAHTRMWIIEENAQPVGVVRIDARAQARISIALAAEAQGRGIGRRAVALACAQWAQPVIAEVHESNTASHACFAASGFHRVGRRDVFDLYQWSP